MYCPGCNAEFREGFTRCLECDLDLVEGHPPVIEPEYVDTVTVYEGDANCVQVACTVLENAGIPFWVEDDALHSVLPSVGSNKINVSVEDEALALEVLAHISEEDGKQ